MSDQTHEPPARVLGVLMSSRARDLGAVTLRHYMTCPICGFVSDSGTELDAHLEMTHQLDRDGRFAIYRQIVESAPLLIQADLDEQMWRDASEWEQALATLDTLTGELADRLPADEIMQSWAERYGDAIEHAIGLASATAAMPPQDPVSAGVSQGETKR